MFLKHLPAFLYLRRPPVESIWSPNSKKGSWYLSLFDEYRSMFLMEKELVSMVCMGAVFGNVVLRIARQIFFLYIGATWVPRHPSTPETRYETFLARPLRSTPQCEPTMFDSISAASFVSPRSFSILHFSVDEWNRRLLFERRTSENQRLKLV